MGIVENATDLEHSILMDRIMEKEKLLKLFQDIDHGAKTVSAKIQSSGKDMVYQISMGRIQGGSQKQTEYVLGLIEQIRADTRQNEIIQALGSNFNSVYYVDVDHDKVYAYKVNSAVRSVLNDTLKEIPGYEAIIGAELLGQSALVPLYAYTFFMIHIYIIYTVKIASQCLNNLILACVCPDLFDQTQYIFRLFL